MPLTVVLWPRRTIAIRLEELRRISVAPAGRVRQQGERNDSPRKQPVARGRTALNPVVGHEANSAKPAAANLAAGATIPLANLPFVGISLVWAEIVCAWFSFGLRMGIRAGRYS